MPHNCEWVECRINRRLLFLLREVVRSPGTNTLQKCIELIGRHPFTYKRNDDDGSIYIVSDSEDDEILPVSDSEDGTEIELPVSDSEEFLNDPDDELSKFIDFCKSEHICRYFDEFWKNLDMNKKRNF